MSNHVQNIAALRNLLDSIIVESQVLTESSPLIKTFGDDELGTKLAQELHRRFHVSADAVLVPYTHSTGNLSLKQFKRHYDNFTILKGPNGWAAFKPSEEYLKTKLDSANYNPSEDKQLQYVVVYSTNDQAGVKIEYFETTRGGRYNRPEKKGVMVKTAADYIKEIVGKPIKEVYRLLSKNDSEWKEMNSAELLGRDPEAAVGASVARNKIAVRQELKSLNTFANEVASLTAALAGRVFQTVRMHSDSELVKDVLYDLANDQEKLKESWNKLVTTAIKEMHKTSGVSEEDFMSDFQDEGVLARKQLFDSIVKMLDTPEKVSRLLNIPIK